MARRRDRREPERSRGLLRRLFSSTLLVGLGAGAGLGLALFSQAPAVLRDWLRGPVQRVVVRPPPPPVPLDRFGELQSSRSGKRDPAPAAPRAQPSTIDVASPPPPAVPGASGAAAQVIGRLKGSVSVPGDPEASVHRPAGVPTGPRDAGTGVVVQVAAYVDRGQAEKLVRDLVQGGFRAYVAMGTTNGLRRFRVRVRPAAHESAAQLAEVLRSRGLETWVTRE